MFSIYCPVGSDHTFIYVVLVGTREEHAYTQKYNVGRDPNVFTRVCVW